MDPEGAATLPGTPGDLPPEWVLDPRHQDHIGDRYRDPDGNFLDGHPGRPGALGWRGNDHWHHNGGKKHHKPGDEIPEEPQSSSKMSCPNCRNTGKLIVTASGAYLIYRCVRLTPSLLPPLWWTLPENVAIP